MNLGYGEPVSEISYPFSNAMALRYVRKSMVALACDNMGTCEQEGLYDRQQFALKMIFKGRNYVGLSVFCRWAMFNWLAEQDYVDENRMGLARPFSRNGNFDVSGPSGAQSQGRLPQRFHE